VVQGVRILPTVDGKGGGEGMYARIFFCKAVKQVILPRLSSHTGSGSG
jgi:hypothetical protein